MVFIIVKKMIIISMILSKGSDKIYNISILGDLFFLILQKNNMEFKTKNLEKLTLWI